MGLFSKLLSLSLLFTSPGSVSASKSNEFSLTSDGNAHEIGTTEHTNEDTSDTSKMSVPYVTLGSDLVCRRILHGLWQTSGGWGNAPTKVAVEAMANLVKQGYTTFDLADHYGPAEDLIGLLNEKSQGDKSLHFQAFTKWVPSPEAMTREKVTAAIQISLDRMKTQQLDLLQFHWWDYDSMPEAIKAMRFMDELRREGKIRYLAVTNFDTAHLRQLVEAGIPIVSNQVQYSLVDMRVSRSPIPRSAKGCATVVG